MIACRFASFCLAAVTTFSTGCSRAACAEAKPAEGPLAMTVEVSGCAAVRKGRICEVTPASRELHLWVEAPGAKLETSFGGKPLAATAREIDGGTLLVATLPEEAPGGPTATAELVVTATAPGKRGEHRLRVERVTPDPALEKVQSLRKGGKLDEAAKAMPAVETFPEPLRGRAKSLAARLALAAGRVEEATEGLTRAMEVHRREGRVSDEATDAMALAHTFLTHGRRIADARKLLAQTEAALREWDEGRPSVGYYRALVARDAGDLRVALRELRESERLANRLGLDAFRRRAQQASAWLLQLVGDNDEAAALLRAVEKDLPAESSACERAQVMTNRAWGELVVQGATAPALVRREAPAPSADELLRGPPKSDAAALLVHASRAPSAEHVLVDARAALELWERSCPKPAEVANARTNLALAALDAGDVGSATEHVRAVRALGALPAHVSVWLLDVDARVALAKPDPSRALKLYDELAARAAAGYAPEAEWRAVVGRGTALEAKGDDREAEIAYRRAETLLDAQAARVPLNDGRAGFLADRDRGVRLLVDLLVRHGRAADALEALRAARVRALRAAQRLDRVASLSPEPKQRWEAALSRFATEREAIERDSETDWSIPADQLEGRRAGRAARQEAARAALDEALASLAEGAAPAVVHQPTKAGQLLLAFQASANGKQVHALAYDERGVRSYSLEAVPANASETELADRLLGPLSEPVATARAILVLSYGPLAAIDFHALPWRGAPLAAHALVEYAADLPGDPPAPRVGRPRALVVADTREDLPNAKGEGNAVGAALTPRGDVRRLEGKSARRGDVLSALVETDLFHFAGHASFDGGRGWESALFVADGGYLRVGDLLALPHAPETVFLSGCETGKAASTRVADMSLAHAFIAAGSRVVIAASRPVEDRLAAALVAKTYEKAGEPGWNIAESFRAAQLEAARTMPETDWRAYRIMTR